MRWVPALTMAPLEEVSHLRTSPDVLVVGGGIIGVATAAACRDAGVGSLLL
jgi:NADPH-dependent 2,4-dienoyl-CoA reductase/sulfur reductase-like enzyme